MEEIVFIFFFWGGVGGGGVVCKLTLIKSTLQFAYLFSLSSTYSSEGG